MLACARCLLYVLLYLPCCIHAYAVLAIFAAVERCTQPMAHPVQGSANTGQDGRVGHIQEIKQQPAPLGYALLPAIDIEVRARPDSAVFRAVERDL